MFMAKNVYDDGGGSILLDTLLKVHVAIYVYCFSIPLLHFSWSSGADFMKYLTKEF